MSSVEIKPVFQILSGIGSLNTPEDLKEQEETLKKTLNDLKTFQEKNADLSEPVSSFVKTLNRALSYLSNEKNNWEEKFSKDFGELISEIKQVSDKNENDALVQIYKKVSKLSLILEYFGGEITPVQVQTYKGSKRIGDYLIELEFVTKEQLEEAFKIQKSGEFPGKRLGDILEFQKIITRAQLDKAIEMQMVDNMED